MNPEIIVCVVFAVFSIFMSVQDIKTQKVSRWCSVVLLVAAVVARLVFWKGEERVGFVASACIAIAVFWAVRFITKKKLGLADVFYSGLNVIVRYEKSEYLIEGFLIGDTS